MVNTERQFRPPAPAAYRAVLLLELLGERREPVTITGAARALTLPKSTVANLLTSLEGAGMVRRHPRGWLLGYKVLELSRSMLVATDLVTEFRHTVAGLPTLARDTALLAVLDGLDVVYVDRHDGQQPVRYINEVGSRMPAVVTALGRAMLAALPAAELEHRLSDVTELPQLTPRSLRSTADLRRDLDRVRDRGYAIDSEQGVSGVACFGVAVRGPHTPTAVRVSLLARRVTPDLQARLVADLAVLARRLRDVEQP